MPTRCQFPGNDWVHSRSCAARENTSPKRQRGNTRTLANASGSYFTATFGAATGMDPEWLGLGVGPTYGADLTGKLTSPPSPGCQPALGYTACKCVKRLKAIGPKSQE